MRLIFLDGSGRVGAYNRRLLRVYEQRLRETTLNFDAIYFSPGTHPLPNVSTREALTPPVSTLCDEVRAAAMGAAAFLIASPEYNGGPTGGLKNLIDWMTRPNEAYPMGNPFEMRPVVLLSASPGALGGIKGLQVMRLIMGHLRALVMPEQIALGHCEAAFDQNGNLTPGLAADLTEKSAMQLATFLQMTHLEIQDVTISG